jgi:stromal membrane-associated protein
MSSCRLQASYNIGIFICLQCAGLHRGLGSHISKVRSVELDAWTAAQVEGLEAVGNAKARQFWEATLREEAAKADLGVFVRRKYVDRAWVGKG